MTSPLSPRLNDAEIRLLRVFETVVECGGFTPAQAELNVSASTISTKIASLEGRLGIRLCHRGRGGFRLTDKGKLVYQAVKQLFVAHESFRTSIGALQEQRIGELRIGMMDNTITNPVAQIHQAIARFMQREYSPQIILNVSEPASLERALLDGKLDIGIAAYYHKIPGLSYNKLFTEEQTLCCGARHPLFSRAPDRVTVEEISECKYVARGYMGHRKATPFTPSNPAATAYDMEAIARLILSGHFIGYLPVHYAALWVDRSEMRAILPDQLNYCSVFEVATRKGVPRTPVVNAFLEDLESVHRGVPRME